MAPAALRKQCTEPDAQQADQGEIQPAAEHCAQDVRIAEPGSRSVAGDERLTDEERGERHDLADDEGDRCDHRAFAARNRPRRGTAVRLVRMACVEYSEEMTSAPSTPMASWAMPRPDVLTEVGSQLVRTPCEPVL